MQMVNLDSTRFLENNELVTKYINELVRNLFVRQPLLHQVLKVPNLGDTESLGVCIQ